MSVKMVAAAVVGGVAVVGSSIGVGVANSPKVVMANAVKGAVEDVLERDEIKPIYTMLKGGSLQASISEWSENGVNYLDKQSYSGKVYFSKDALMLEDVTVQIDTFKLQADAYLSSDFVYINEDKILGDAYGFKMEDLAGDLDDSIFAYDSGSKYSLKNVMDEDMYDQLMESLESGAKSKKMTKEAEKIAKRYAKKIGKIIAKHAEFSSEGDKEKLTDKKKNVRVVTMALDGDALAAIVEDVYDFLVKDDDVVKFLDKYEDEFAVVSETFDYDSLAEWYEDTLDDYEDTVELLCEAYEDYDEEIEVKVCTPKASSKLLKLEVEYDRETIFSLDVGSKGIKNSEAISMEIYGTELGYEVKKNTKDTYKSVFGIDGVELASFTLNRSSGKYKAKIDGVEFSGKLEKSGDSITIELDEIVDKYGSLDTLKITTDLQVTIQEKDKMPSVPKDYKTIADIREKDIDGWISTINKKLG